MGKEKDTRPEWHGHITTISKICGCSKTTVSKVLNGHAKEVTTNAQLIERILKTASELLVRDSNILLDQAEQKKAVARQLVA